MLPPCCPPQSTHSREPHHCAHLDCKAQACAHLVAVFLPSTAQAGTMVEAWARRRPDSLGGGGQFSTLVPQTIRSKPPGLDVYLNN